MTYETVSAITAEADPYYGRLRKDRPKDNLEAVLGSIEHFHLRCAVSMIPTAVCFEILSSITITDSYPDELRALFFFINEKLTRQGIAPAWRGIIKIQYQSDDGPTPAQQRYGCDCQIIDLLWVYSNHTVCQANSGWDGLYEGFFQENEFNYKRADDIANASFKPNEKSKNLKLTDAMQSELCVLRSDKIRMRVRRAVKSSHEVETDILNAANINPRMGKKVTEQAQPWSKIWRCRKIFGSSPEKIAEAYLRMTGVHISRSAVSKKLHKIDRALAVANSKYRRSV